MLEIKSQQIQQTHGPLVQAHVLARETFERTMFSYEMNNAHVQHVHIQDPGRAYTY